MQAPTREYVQLAEALTDSGILFLVLTLRELRRQGLTLTAFYALQRVIEDRVCTELSLRNATRLSDYEISRACRMLAKSDLIETKKSDTDKRVRVLSATRRGIRVRDRILAQAGKVLQDEFPAPEYKHQIPKVIEAFRLANDALHGEFQIPFGGLLDELELKRRKRRKRTKRADSAPTSSKP
jgi:DNA-binding MarR family transcriptional regulator